MEIVRLPTQEYHQLIINGICNTPGEFFPVFGPYDSLYESISEEIYQALMDYYDLTWEQD